jgi:hypothetical protein
MQLSQTIHISLLGRPPNAQTLVLIRLRYNMKMYLWLTGQYN